MHRLRFWLLMAAAWGGCGLIVFALSGRGEVSLRVLGIVLPIAIGVGTFIVASLLLAILVHELGHVLAGKRAGFEFQSMAVGPVEWRYRDGRVRAHLVQMGKASGFTRMVPRGEGDLVGRMMMFIAGGPLASLFYCAVTYFVFYFTPALVRGKGFLHGAPHLAALSLFLMALAVLPGTLVPFTSASGNMTDMKVLLTLAGRQEGRERLVALLLLSREIVGGLRARNWNAQLLQAATAVTDGSPEELRARIFAFYHHDDAGELEKAQRDLARAIRIVDRLKGKGGILREAALVEAAYEAAWRRGALDEAKARLEEAAPASEALGGAWALAQAAVCVRQQRTEEAKRLLDDAEEKLRETSARFGGSIDYDLERVAAVRAATATSPAS